MINEIERKYLLKSDLVKDLIKNAKKIEGLIQWYLEPPEGFVERRVRLVVEKNPSGFSKKWFETKKSDLFDGDKRVEDEARIKISNGVLKEIKGSKMVAKVRYYIDTNPEIVIDEFLYPYGHFYNNIPESFYLMEIELKNDSDNFEDILNRKITGDLVLNDFVSERVEEKDFKKFSNKNIANFTGVDFNMVIKYVQNRLYGSTCVVISQGTSILSDRNEKIHNCIYEKNFDLLSSVKDLNTCSPEVSTISDFRNDGYLIDNVHMFIFADFFNKDSDEKLKKKYPDDYSDEINKSYLFLKVILREVFNIKSVDYTVIEDIENNNNNFNVVWNTLECVDLKYNYCLIDAAAGFRHIGIICSIYAMFNKKSYYCKINGLKEIIEFPAFGFDWDHSFLDGFSSIMKSKNIFEGMEEDDYFILPDVISNIYNKSDDKIISFYPVKKMIEQYDKKREIPFGFGERLLNFISDLRLRNYVEDGIKKKWTSLWLGDLIPETVEHSQRHSKRLIDFTLNLINVLGESDFLPEDIEGDYFNGFSYKDLFYFLFIIAVNVHDLGHTYSNFYFDTNGYSDYSDYKMVNIDKFPLLVRDLHNELTLHLIKNDNFFDVLGIERAFSENSDSLKCLFGEKYEEILYAILFICKYHRGYLGIDKKHKEKEKDFVEILGLDTTPLKMALDSCKFINDEKLKSLIIHITRWLKFIDGTDVQADRIITDSYHDIRLNRTRYEILNFIQKFQKKYFDNHYYYNLVGEIKEKVENNDFPAIKDLNKDIEKEVYDFIGKHLKNKDLNIYNSMYEELSQISFKAAQFEHFEKHKAIGAIYPVALEYKNNEKEAYLSLEIIRNEGVDNDVIKKIKKEINDELEMAEIFINNRKLFLRVEG